MDRTEDQNIKQNKSGSEGERLHIVHIENMFVIVRLFEMTRGRWEKKRE
jgi:hypothetical protein